MSRIGVEPPEGWHIGPSSRLMDLVGSKRIAIDPDAHMVTLTMRIGTDFADVLRVMDSFGDGKSRMHIFPCHVHYVPNLPRPNQHGPYNVEHWGAKNKKRPPIRPRRFD